ncbi:hypothetical protein GCM10010151_38690 [Actinoallomurus spadix]|uniref:Uncharacterized protein n=1 Tax=Actinoallomurus spadix TaxID=79912 RepID=A0ABN0WSF9_9ACTN
MDLVAVRAVSRDRPVASPAAGQAGHGGTTPPVDTVASVRPPQAVAPAPPVRAASGSPPGTRSGSAVRSDQAVSALGTTRPRAGLSLAGPSLSAVTRRARADAAVSSGGMTPADAAPPGPEAAVRPLPETAATSAVDLRTDGQPAGATKTAARPSVLPIVTRGVTPKGMNVGKSVTPVPATPTHGTAARPDRAIRVGGTRAGPVAAVASRAVKARSVVRVRVALRAETIGLRAAREGFADPRRDPALGIGPRRAPGTARAARNVSSAVTRVEAGSSAVTRARAGAGAETRARVGSSAGMKARVVVRAVREAAGTSATGRAAVRATAVAKARKVASGGATTLKAHGDRPSGVRVGRVVTAGRRMLRDRAVSPARPSLKRSRARNSTRRLGPS